MYVCIEGCMYATEHLPSPLSLPTPIPLPPSPPPLQKKGTMAILRTEEYCAKLISLSLSSYPVFAGKCQNGSSNE